ncbi:import inner membrane translocase subunit tim21 [Histoplasma ohiense]|nr:import inner membrane translocase subunit tim21 [Histoplasma ohiense (nom. inval.)]
MTSVFRARSVLRSLSAANPAKKHTFKPWEALSRYYATQNSFGGASSSSNPQQSRKQITVASDDGRVRWGELSRREKAARATQQSANFLIIVIGAAMTGAVFTLLYQEVFAPDSKTRNFNRAVDRIKEDQRCIELLGDSNKIRAYGETTWNKWTRNRPIATTVEKDRVGREHMRMNFNVSGPRNDGTVSVHLIKNPQTNEFEYNILALDVKGHQRLYLENAGANKNAAKKAATKIFGIQWR